MGEFPGGDFGGITYKDRYFYRQKDFSEDLHFPELVHVVQWETLGAENFLLAYGSGLDGYDDSRLEMAHELQREFNCGVYRPEQL